MTVKGIMVPIYCHRSIKGPTRYFSLKNYINHLEKGLKWCCQCDDNYASNYKFWWLRLSWRPACLSSACGTITPTTTWGSVGPSPRDRCQWLPASVANHSKKLSYRVQKFIKRNFCEIIHSYRNRI